MTGSTEAAFVIPIVAFCLLFAWLFLVFWADGHPRWGNSEPGEQASSRPGSLQEGSSVPRPRVEGSGVPEQPARESEHARR